MTSALVSGGLGFIGSHLVGKLLERADLAKIVVVDNLWTGSAENENYMRDPRVDIVHSSRQVRVEVDGVVLAESDSAHLLFEPPLPVRYYFPLDDVRTELLEASDLVTRCAYKDEASYFSIAGQPDLAWGYREPLRDSAEITGRIAFFNERERKRS